MARDQAGGNLFHADSSTASHQSSWTIPSKYSCRPRALLEAGMMQRVGGLDNVEPFLPHQSLLTNDRTY